LVQHTRFSQQIPVVGFVAHSGTGKTTLLKRLIPLLRSRGIRVGLIKHTHHTFDMDTPGKDSYELRRAGATQVLLASRRRWALLAENPKAVAEPDLQTMLEQLDGRHLDLVLVEGFKHAAFPKVALYRAASGKPPTYPGDPHVMAVAAEGPLPVPTALPLFDLNRAEAIADFLIDHLRLYRRDTDMTADPKADLVRHYRWLRQYGCNDSHSGNASLRAGDHFWITPTGACADTLDPEQLVSCPLRGAVTEGASLDARLHQRVYQENAQAAALLHSHGPYTVAVTLSGQDFTPVDFEGQYYFGSVPVLTIAYDRYLEEAPAAVARELASHPIAVVRGHGVYASAPTLNLAYKWTCSLELSAKTYLIARQAGSL
jgi:L-fuculose-phosphate aldolase